MPELVLQDLEFNDMKESEVMTGVPKLSKTNSAQVQPAPLCKHGNPAFFRGGDPVANYLNKIPPNWDQAKKHA